VPRDAEGDDVVCKTVAPDDEHSMPLLPTIEVLTTELGEEARFDVMTS
jgi:hypothetical protein